MLKTQNIARIWIGLSYLTDQDLEAIFASDESSSRNVFEGTELKDMEMLELLLHHFCPITLTGNIGTVLGSEIARFPYTLNGNQNLQAISYRLYPMQQEVLCVDVLCNQGVTVNSMSATSDVIVLEMGHGKVRLEIYLCNVHSGELPELKQPFGFTQEQFSTTDY